MAFENDWTLPLHFVVSFDCAILWVRGFRCFHYFPVSPNTLGNELQYPVIVLKSFEYKIYAHSYYHILGTGFPNSHFQIHKNYSFLYLNKPKLLQKTCWHQIKTLFKMIFFTRKLKSKTQPYFLYPFPVIDLSDYTQIGAIYLELYLSGSRTATDGKHVVVKCRLSNFYHKLNCSEINQHTKSLIFF